MPQPILAEPLRGPHKGPPLLNPNVPGGRGTVYANPRKVRNLVAIAVAAGEIDLSWDAVSEPVPAVYDIERNGVVFLENYTYTAYSDVGLNPSTLYTYRVRAVDGYDVYADGHADVF
jgi:hypothetical protein